jgi:hypothetical protein
MACCVVNWQLCCLDSHKIRLWFRPCVTPENGDQAQSCFMYRVRNSFLTAVSNKLTDRLWGLPSRLLFSRCRGPFPRDEAARVWRNKEGKKGHGRRRIEMISGRNGEGEEKSEKVCVLFSNGCDTNLWHVVGIMNTRCVCRVGWIFAYRYLYWTMCVRSGKLFGSLRLLYKEIVIWCLWNAS